MLPPEFRNGTNSASCLSSKENVCERFSLLVFYCFSWKEHGPRKAKLIFAISSDVA